MASALSSLLAAHATLMADSEALRQSQESSRSEEGALSTSTTAPANAPPPNASKPLEPHPHSEASLEAASYAQRVYVAATTWREALDVDNLAAEFRTAPRRLILSASAASAAALALSFAKTRATGQLFDAITRQWGGGSGGGGVGHASDASAAAALHIICWLLLFGAGEIAACMARDYFFARAKAARVVQARVLYLRSMLNQVGALLWCVCVVPAKTDNGLAHTTHLGVVNVTYG